MYRDEHEAALRRAEALEREVEELRENARGSAAVVDRIQALEQEVAERREQNSEDALRLGDLQRRLDALRAEVTGHRARPPRVHDLDTGMVMLRPGPGPRRAVAVGLALVGLLMMMGGAAGFWALSYAPAEEDDSLAEPKPERPPPEASREERAREIYAEGLALVESRREEARTLFYEAIGLHASLPEPYRELALLALEDGQGENACAHLWTYLELAPDAASHDRFAGMYDVNCVAEQGDLGSVVSRVNLTE